jgi:hypothetical protein
VHVVEDDFGMVVPQRHQVARGNFYEADGVDQIQEAVLYCRAHLNDTLVVDPKEMSPHLKLFQFLGLGFVGFGDFIWDLKILGSKLGILRAFFKLGFHILANFEGFFRFSSSSPSSC